MVDVKTILDWILVQWLSKMFIDAGQKYILLSSPNEKINHTDKLPDESEYICDMCMEKFSQPDKLQEHRTDKHRAPTGV